MPNVVEHRKFICVEFGDTNNNKFWQYTIYDDDTALTEWGRVGGHVSSKMTNRSTALSKMREKTNPNNKPDKLYTEVKAIGSTEQKYGSSSTSAVQTSKLKDIAKQQIRTQSKVVQDLIDFLVKVNAHQIIAATGGSIQYDATNATFTTPLGVINPEQVQEARDILTKIANILHSRTRMMDINPLLSQYLRRIPHDVGMKKITPDLIFPDMSAVQKENDLLDGLETSFDASIKVKDSDKDKKKDKKDNAPAIFNVELEIVEDEKIISWAKNLYQSTRKAMHQSNDLSVQRVYKVDIESMRKAFENRGKQVGNIMQLWHGTKASNLLSIMRKGLIIPPSSSPHCTGRMYGDGLYFSCISTKALNYATNFWGSGGNVDRTFMFLADVAMGKAFIAGSGGYYGYPRSGYDSTWAKGGQSGVINDEMIVYKVDQANLIYLVEFVPRSQYRK